MGRPQWPKLCQETPADLKEHAASFAKDFQAVRDFANASVSDVAPSLPKGIQRKIRKGIQKGLVETESLSSCYSSLSSSDQDFTINAIVNNITAEPAAAFQQRVPQYLFNVIHNSYKELHLKLVTRVDSASAPGDDIAGIASVNKILPHSPPESPLEGTDPDTESVTDSEMSSEYGSDTSGFAHYNRDRSMIPLDSRAGKLELELQEVDRQYKALSKRFEDKAAKIKADMQDIERARRAVNEAHDETIEAMKLSRVERDRTGEYSTCTVVYRFNNRVEDDLAGSQDNTRCISLKIEKQAAVNRLFNMPSRVLMRKIRDVILKRNEPGPNNSACSTINSFLGVKLAMDGNILLWVESTNDYDWQNSEGDMFGSLQDVPLWDHELFTGVARHVTEPYKPFKVEMKHITADMIPLTFRKQKAAVITELVKQNITFILSLYVDVVKDIQFCRSTTYDNSQALVLEFSNPSVANEVIASGLQWQRRYYTCEVFDNQFFDRCGRCYTYDHHAQACTGALRCGHCAEAHLTTLCESSLTKCASCNRRHRFGSSKCRAKRALDKCYTRFPTAEDSSPLAMPSEEREDLNTSSDSLAVNFPAPQGEPVRATKKSPLNLAPAQIHTEAAGKLIISAQQLHDENPTTEDALGSNDSAKRGLTSTTEGFEPAPKIRFEERTNLTSTALEKIRGISEDPAQELQIEKWTTLTLDELEKSRRISEEPAQEPLIEDRRSVTIEELVKRRRISFEPAQEPRLKRKREWAGKESEKRRFSEDPAQEPGAEKRRKVTRR